MSFFFTLASCNYTPFGYDYILLRFKSHLVNTFRTISIEFKFRTFYNFIMDVVVSLTNCLFNTTAFGKDDEQFERKRRRWWWQKGSKLIQKNKIWMIEGVYCIVSSFIWFSVCIVIDLNLSHEQSIASVICCHQWVFFF